jgi:peptidoglycan hydrolase-like protein with peptidoglycan-binding domain
MSASENREIEILLARLGYMRGGADGVITTSTRQAIRTYQRDIGAPVTGFVSTPLLQSLRSNAPHQAATATTYTQPTKKKAATRTAPNRRPVTAKKPAAAPYAKPTGEAGGGTGGSGGGAWN